MEHLDMLNVKENAKMFRFTVAGLKEIELPQN